MKRKALLTLFAAALPAGLPGAGAGVAEAQATAWVGPAPAWLGLSYEVEWRARGRACEPRVIIESVVQGAPADRAGLRPGDALLALDGTPVAGSRLQLLGTRLAVGDSVRLTVTRDGTTRQVLAVAGRRPDRPPVVLRRARNGLFASDAPIVRLRSDTLVVTNLESTETVRRRGYWLDREEGRAEFRRVGRLSGDPLDRRVVDLLTCAERTQAAAPMAATARRITVQEVQEQADSLRHMYVRRSLETPRVDVVWVPAERGEAPAAPAREVRVFPAPAAAPEIPAPPAPGFYAFRVGDHLSAAERGVAGAEVTSLEPELAEYFRGARQGLLVLRVAPGTPAARAGLRPGDVITAGGGRRLADVVDLRRLLSLPEPAPLELQVIRHGRARTLTLARE